jgi:hypothetical protein
MKLSKVKEFVFGYPRLSWGDVATGYYIAPGKPNVVIRAWRHMFGRHLDMSSLTPMGYVDETGTE